MSNATRERRIVRLRTPITKGHGSVVWGYGYETLSELTGLSVDVVRHDVARGILLDPSDLRFVLAWLLDRSRRSALRDIEKGDLAERVRRPRPLE